MAYNELFDKIESGYDGSLFLGYSQIGNNGLKKLVGILNTRNVRCRGLYLYSNIIHNDGMVELSKYLKINDTIKTLFISGNSFDGGCMDEFSDMIKYNDSIDYLKMGWNKIGDLGVIKLCDALKYNTTLRSLHLRGCNITNNVASYIIKMLEYNYTLQSINIDGNYIDNSYIAETWNMLKIPYKINKLGWYIYNHKYWDNKMKNIIYNMIMINNTDVNNLPFLPNELMYLIFYFIKN